MAKSNGSVLVIGDVHEPWSHGPTLEKIYAAVEEIKPDVVLQIGDLRDLYSFSRYPVNPNAITPEREIDRGTAACTKMWERVRKANPKARRIQLLGNHDERPSKRLSETLPACKLLAAPTLKALFEFPGVETHHDPAQEFFLNTAAGEVCFMHGHRAKLGDHAKYNQMPTVCGHSHQGGVVYLRHKSKVFWELNAGWCGDETAPVFKYGNQRALKTWTRGFGLIDSRGPRFVSLTGGSR